MSIAQFIAIVAGLLTEFALLFGKKEGKTADIEPDSHSRLPNSIAILSHEQRIFLFGSIALLFSIAINQLPSSTHLFESLLNLFMLIAGLSVGAILLSALFDDRMLPRVNEQQMLIVHLIVGVNLLINQTLALPNRAIWLLLIPTAALFLQAVWPHLLPLTVRAIFYFWYLIMLLILTLQNGSGDYLDIDRLSMPELYIAASIGIFLAAHFLLTLRFLVIVPSLILPRNRPLLQLIMPKIMQDEQMSPTVLTAVMLLFGGILAINYWWELVLDQTLINLLILAVLQLPKKLSESS